MIKNENGFTLAEVMVAFVILLMVSQLLIFGSAAARKMERRAKELSIEAEVLREHLMERSDCISGTVSLKMDENTELSGEGWLYQNEKLSEQDLVINAIYIEEGN